MFLPVCGLRSRPKMQKRSSARRSWKQVTLRGPLNSVFVSEAPHGASHDPHEFRSNEPVSR